tara:strand:- start:3068 stop:3919 length:852 start_codon:yes stop_codon:yes gene_type:complete
MAINFPNTPNINDIHSSSGQNWKWDGVTWQSTGNTGDGGVAGINTVGTSEFNNLKVTGVSTFVGLATFNGYVDIGSGVHLQNNRAFNFGGTSFGSGGTGNDSGLSITSDPSISGAEIKTGGNTTDGTLVLRNKEVFVQDKSSVGIVTIRDGVTVSGMVTATAFSGDGSNLTNLPSAQGSSTVGGSSVGINAAQTVVLDSIPTSNLTVDYNLYFSHSLGKQSQQVTLLNDGSNSHIQQSGITFDNHILVSVGSSIVGGNLTLNATPETGVTGTLTYKFLRTEVS